MLPRQCFAALVVLDSREKAEDLAAEVPHIADAEHRARPAKRSGERVVSHKWIGAHNLCGGRYFVH